MQQSMYAQGALRRWVQSDLLHDVRTHKDHRAAHSAMLWISAQFAEMLDCIAEGEP